jgi:hypothetical protein
MDGGGRDAGSFWEPLGRRGMGFGGFGLFGEGYALEFVDMVVTGL